MKTFDLRPSEWEGGNKDPAHEERLRKRGRFLPGRKRLGVLRVLSSNTFIFVCFCIASLLPLVSLQFQAIIVPLIGFLGLFWLYQRFSETWH